MFIFPSINTTAVIWMIPFGLSSAARLVIHGTIPLLSTILTWLALLLCSIRVSNELGAEDPKAAHLAVRVVLFLAISQGILVGLVLILMRNIWGYAYSNDVQVIRYVTAMIPILATSNFIDGVQCVLSGFSLQAYI